MQRAYLIRCCLPALVTVIVCLAAPNAGAALQMRAGYAAGEQGFSLQYAIPLIGRHAVSLTHPGDADQIPVRLGALVVARAEIELSDINTDNSSLDLRVTVTSPFMPDETPEFTVSVPFGSADMGAFMQLLGRRLPPLAGHDIEISLLLTKNRSAYRAHLHAPPLISDLSLEGEAEDNQILIDLPGLAAVTLTLEPGAYATNVWFAVEPIMPELPDMPDGAGHHLDIEIEPITGGPLTLPNGSYRAWCDFDIDLGSVFLPRPE